MKTQPLADIDIFAGDGKPELPGQWIPKLELGDQGNSLVTVEAKHVDCSVYLRYFFMQKYGGYYG